jgi:hypothetical protein
LWAFVHSPPFHGGVQARGKLHILSPREECFNFCHCKQEDLGVQFALHLWRGSIAALIVDFDIIVKSKGLVT